MWRRIRFIRLEALTTKATSLVIQFEEIHVLLRTDTE
jgi:hypothetical protein